MKWLGLWLCAMPLLAQKVSSGTTFQEQAARLQNIQAYLLDFRPNAAPTTVLKRTFEGSIDLEHQPGVDTRVGLKDEPVDTPAFVPKLRGRYLSSSGLFAGAAFAPGVTFEGYKVKFVSLELGFRKKYFGFDWGLRASYSDGEVDGAITEPEVKDHFEYRNLGWDLSAGRSYQGWDFYGFLGGNDIRTSLDVAVDGAHLRNKDQAPYLGLGVALNKGAWRVHFEQDFTDHYLAHLTMGLTRRF